MSADSIEPQEWTPESVRALMHYPSAHIVIVDAHNTALAAERKKRKEAEAMMLDAYEKAKVMRTELQRAQDALKALRIHRNVDYWKLIDAALAEEGK